MTDLATIDHDSAQKVDQLWFDDADVVFQAGNKRFRVHRSILSARSTIFKDMFAVPQNDESENTPSGDEVTVIHLPDEEMDVYYFFLAIFDASFYNPPPSTYPLNMTVSILRLAHKYDVPFLRRRAIAHLDPFFPLEREELLKTIIRVQEFPNKTQCQTLQSFLDMIPLSTIADVQWILPSLLYLLVSLCPISETMGQDKFRNLSSPLQLLIVQFEVQYWLESHGKKGWLGILPAERCKSHVACKALSHELQKMQHHCAPSKSLQLDVFLKTNSGKTFCGYCKMAGKKSQKELVEIYWDKYPTICSFSGWAVLKKMRKVSMSG